MFLLFIWNEYLSQEFFHVLAISGDVCELCRLLSKFSHKVTIKKQTHELEHTHTHIYIYIYIYGFLVA